MNPSHLCKLLLLCLASCLASCAAPSSTVDEATIRRLLPGTWEQEVSRGSRGMLFEKTYHADGTAKGQAVHYEDRGGGRVFNGNVQFRSKWRLKGVILESYDVRCSEPGLFKEGDVFVDRIISIDAEKKIYENITHGGVETSRRWTGIDSDGQAMPRKLAAAYQEELRSNAGMPKPR